MKIIDKINAKQDMYNNPPATIVFLGDSITQGCFEVFFTTSGTIDTIYENGNSFSTKVREIFAYLYPNAQVNIINSGISGDSVKGGLKRLERDVLKFSPDLVVVGYGANDCTLGREKATEYGEDLRALFAKIKACGAEIIYLTEGPLCTTLSPFLTDERLKALSNDFAKLENEGVLEEYFRIGKKTAKEEGVKICDVYSAWKKLEKNGVNTTELLANKLNHPSREFHHYMAIKLIETMFED